MATFGTTAGQPRDNRQATRGATNGTTTGQARDNRCFSFSILSGWVTDSPGPAAVPLWGSCVAKLGVAPFSSLRHPDFCYSGEKG